VAGGVEALQVGEVAEGPGRVVDLLFLEIPVGRIRLELTKPRLDRFVFEPLSELLVAGKPDKGVDDIWIQRLPPARDRDLDGGLASPELVEDLEEDRGVDDT
jgi:hypothetical protein